MHRMAKRGLRKIPWLPPESWHKRNINEPILLVPRIARSLRPVRVPPGILPVNHNLSIVAANRVTLDEIEEMLSSKEANEWMQAHAARRRIDGLNAADGRDDAGKHQSVPFIQPRQHANVITDTRDVGDAHIAPPGEIIQRRQVEHALGSITEDAWRHVNQQFIDQTFVKE